MRPVLQVGELSVGGGQGRGEVGGLTAGFAANGAGMSSTVLQEPDSAAPSLAGWSVALRLRRPTDYEGGPGLRAGSLSCG